MLRIRVSIVLSDGAGFFFTSPWIRIPTIIKIRITPNNHNIGAAGSMLHIYIKIILKKFMEVGEYLCMLGY